MRWPVCWRWVKDSLLRVIVRFASVKRTQRLLKLCKCIYISVFKSNLVSFFISVFRFLILYTASSQQMTAEVGC